MIGIQELIKLARDDDYFFQATRRPGSLVVLRGREGITPDDLSVAAAICARYSKEKEDPVFEIDYWRGGERKEVKQIPASPMLDEELDSFRI